MSNATRQRHLRRGEWRGASALHRCCRLNNRLQIDLPGGGRTVDRRWLCAAALWREAERRGLGGGTFRQGLQ